MNATWRVLVVLTLGACARAGSGDGANADTAMKSADSPAVRPVDSNAVPVVRPVDSTAAPIVITLRRDSLGVTAQHSVQQINSRIDAVLPRLKSVADFDVLAISAPLLAINARPKAPLTADSFIATLRTHPLVQSVERSGVQRIP